MPETRFHVRWPNGSEEACYSPSTVIAEHFAPGDSFPVLEFVARAVKALEAASERVRARFGMGCSRAMSQAAAIRKTAETFAGEPGATVTIVRIES
jgi:uncharacterized repeat protein (TIGR04042 family)